MCEVIPSLTDMVSDESSAQVPLFFYLRYFSSCQAVK